MSDSTNNPTWLRGEALDRYIATGHDPLDGYAKSGGNSGRGFDLVDSRGRPLVIEKANGEWNGPFFGAGENGNLFELGPLEHPFQRNLRIGGQDGNAAAYASIAAYAQTMATMGMYHYRQLDNGGREMITTSALSRILRYPNWYQHLSDFMLNFVFALMTTGNAYGVVFRNDRNEVDSIHLVPSTSTTPYVETETQSVFYGIGPNPMLQTPMMLVPARDVLHVRLFTPQHPLIGVSPIRYAASAMSINNAISGNQAAFFSNMSRPSGVLSTDEKLNKEQMDALRAAWEARSKGINAGSVPILSWGLKWQQMTITSEDAQLIEAYRMSTEDIARVFRVPLALIGDYTKATYNNTETMINAWLSTGLGFLMEHVERSFEQFFKLPPDQGVNFDETVLLRTDFDTRINGLTKAVAGGVYSPNEARARENLPAVEYGDEPRVQAQNLPLSAVGTMPETPATPATPATPGDQPPTDPATPADEQASIGEAHDVILKSMGIAA
jgi:HK97 family phage portal protein